MFLNIRLRQFNAPVVAVEHAIDHRATTEKDDAIVRASQRLSVFIRHCTASAQSILTSWPNFGRDYLEDNDTNNTIRHGGFFSVAWNSGRGRRVLKCVRLCG